jgi:hypothetical protein
LGLPRSAVALLAGVPLVIFFWPLNCAGGIPATSLC